MALLTTLFLFLESVQCSRLTLGRAVPPMAWDQATIHALPQLKPPKLVKWVPLQEHPFLNEATVGVEDFAEHSEIHENHGRLDLQLHSAVLNSPVVVVPRRTKRNHQSVNLTTTRKSPSHHPRREENAFQDYVLRLNHERERNEIKLAREKFKHRQRNADRNSRGDTENTKSQQLGLGALSEMERETNNQRKVTSVSCTLLLFVYRRHMIDYALCLACTDCPANRVALVPRVTA